MNQSSLENSNAVRIAFVQARWHADIVDQCRLSFIDEIERLTNGSAQVEVFDVPGAFEIPLQAPCRRRLPSLPLLHRSTR